MNDARKRDDFETFWRPVLRLTLSVLSLVQRAVEEALRGGGAPTIVTAAVQDLDRHSRLIEEVVRHAEGLYIDAADSADGVPTGLDLPELSLVVRRSFTRPGVVEIGRVGDRTVATAAGASAAGGSPSLRETLGIAATLFDARLQGHTLAAVSYRETNLDPFSADEAWGFFCRQLNGVPLGTIRSILVFVDTPRVRYERFCTPEPSLRFRLEGNRVSHRQPWSVDEGNIRKLAEEAGTNGIALFLGAGFSQSSSLPFGVELRDEAIRTLLNTTETQPEKLASLLLDRLDAEGRLSDIERTQTRQQFAAGLTLERVLQEELAEKPADESPTILHLQRLDAAAIAAPAVGPRSLHDLVKAGGKVIVVTVNFDHLVESGLSACRVFSADDEFLEAPDHVRAYLDGHDERVPILKLHGSVDRPETVVATVNAIAAGMSVPKRAALIAIAARDLPWVYVGYSFRDPDVIAVLQLREFQAGREWWVSPFPVVATEAFINDHRPDRDLRKGMAITQGSDAFFEMLAAR